MIERPPRIALLIDADNSPSSKIDVILAELAKVGVANIRRAYGNWKKDGLKGWEGVLLKRVDASYASGRRTPDWRKVKLEREQEFVIGGFTAPTQGAVRDCRVLKSLPFMDRAVIDALTHRRYSPALLHGQPIEVDYTFKIKLTLPQ